MVSNKMLCGTKFIVKISSSVLLLQNVTLDRLGYRLNLIFNVQRFIVYILMSPFSFFNVSLLIFNVTIFQKTDDRKDSHRIIATYSKQAKDGQPTKIVVRLKFSYDKCEKKNININFHLGFLSDEDFRHVKPGCAGKTWIITSTLYKYRI